MDFTLSNCKDLDVRKVICGITKRFAILLVMMVMITSKALAGASFEVIDGFKYILDSDTKTATLVPNTEKYAGDVVIPGSVKAKDGNDYKVTAFGDKCFYQCSGLTSITIPSSVTSLGDWCFCYCYCLASITIPSSVTSFGDYCFDSCSSLTSITIPPSVTSLGKGCFSYCSGLTSITIPSSVTSLGGDCFAGCGLTSIVIPSSVTSLGEYCFSNCSGLTSITIPSSVTSLGKYCLSCNNLENIYFKGKNPYHISKAEIPTKCIIYVPTEYLQDYKDALGVD